MKEQILELRQQGKTYKEIQQILNCSKSTISYYCNVNQKEKVKQRTTKYRKTSLKAILNRKISEFCCLPKCTRGKNKLREKPTFNYQDVINKFGKTPTCYLTGEKIDLYDKSSYHLDHIIPRSRGGKNTLDNLGLATKIANETKNDRTLEELKNLCEVILKNI